MPTTHRILLSYFMRSWRIRVKLIIKVIIIVMVKKR